MDSRCRVALEQAIMAEAGSETGAADGLPAPNMNCPRALVGQPSSRSPPISRIARPLPLPPLGRRACLLWQPWPAPDQLDLPFSMRLARYTDTIIRRFSIHEKVLLHGDAVFARIREP